MTKGFRYEADMLIHIADQMKALVDESHGVNVFYEVQCAAGIPDLVFIQFDCNALNSRREAKLSPITNLLSISALQEMQTAQRRGEESLTPTQISRKVGVSASHLSSSILPSLVEGGHVNKIRRGHYRANYEKRSLAKKVYTVEAKLKDWRSGYAQALRHSVTADAAWLVMDSAYSGAPSKQASWFEGAGIGLAFLCQGESLTPLVQPTLRTGRSPYRELLAERAAELYWAGQVSGPTQPVFGNHLTTTTGPDPRHQGVEEYSAQLEGVH